jgi:hypothetical protein
MAPNYSSLHDQLLKKILAALPKSVAKSSREFVGDFYELSTVHDLEGISASRAARIALECEKFFAVPPQGRPQN